jgi:D-3-phosphoglycerate dehydrogenase
MKVLASDKIAESGLKMLRDAGIEADMKTKLPEEELCKIIGDYDALIVRSGTKVTPKVIAAGKNLKIIGRAGVGVDNVDLPSATKRGIIVVNSPEGNTIAAAEQTLTLILAMARNIPQAYNSLRAGKWERNKFTGTELYKKVIGVVGLGKIGGRVASYLVAMGAKVIGSDPFVSKERADELGIELKSLDEVISSSEIITLHIPKTKDTENLISKKTIAKMKDKVRIVNCARGGVVSEEDLYEALKSGKVAAAALDVYSKEPPDPKNPLFTLDNIVVAPHLGAATVEAQENVAIDVVEQIIDVLKGGQARSAVNIPSMKPDVIAKVKPYMGLAEKLGSLASQLFGGAFNEVKVEYDGEIAVHDVSPLSIAILKGLLEPVMQESVNFVNAPIIAKERGIKVIEGKSAEPKDFKSLITVKLEAGKIKRSVQGTLFEPPYGERLVGIDGFKVDVVPSGYMLILNNIDKPGMIGKVGTFLGKHKINIAAMDVGRVKVGERAVMVLNVDYRGNRGSDARKSLVSATKKS